ncbi:armadillo-type fold protein [Artemisia annua]|uniref:Armadillo-type fold protein n=1 Tax=Artemisia annua TaxID=35608 RepID=A0A2U1QKT3_ARTAN|nr:armadillo-type fold protein [Artemisia annua]
MEEENERSNQNKETLVEQISNKLINGNLEMKIQAAKELKSVIRSRNSGVNIRAKFASAGVIEPLVMMIHENHHDDAVEASLLALLNLASSNERIKEQMVTCGAIPPLVELLKFQNTNNLRDLATTTILTLSATPKNKLAIVNSEAIPLLVQILRCGTSQGKVDAVTTLHNLTTSKKQPTIILDTTISSPLIDLLKECKKYSKFAEITTGLIKIISKSQEGITSITNAENGILTLVETIEDGSLLSKEHTVSVLLTLCMSSRNKYRKLILDEGPIPGLLRLTRYGTCKARSKAKMLLDLLRDSPLEKKLTQSVLEKMVRKIADRANESRKRTVESAKILLQDMVQIRMTMATGTFYYIFDVAFKGQLCMAIYNVKYYHSKIA